MIIIDLGEGNRIDLSSVRLDIIDTEGNVLLSDIVTDKWETDETRNTTIMPPAKAFKIKLRGKSQKFEQLLKDIDNLDWKANLFTVLKLVFIDFWNSRKLNRVGIKQNS